MDEEFYRIKRLPPYIFAQINKLKMQLRQQGQDIIDFGFGNPDLPSPEHVVKKLVETVQKPRTNGYSASKGISGLRQACGRYYHRRFHVGLDPEDEIIVTLGSKEGFANFAQAITSPGDEIYIPDPSYPLHAYGFILAGGHIHPVPAENAQIYLAGVKAALSEGRSRPKAIVVCFPSNPTGCVADLDFYAEMIALARKYNIIIVSDLAYAEIYFDYPPPSIFEVEGAKEVAVETTSLSKTYSMAGWRIGFMVGGKHLITALARVKSYLDYGAFTPVQVAACAALDGPQECVEQMRAVYRSRRDTLIGSFARAGWNIPSPQASMFVWAPLPERFKEMGALKFSKLIMQQAGLAVAPGNGFGANGEGYVRMALVENEQRIRQAAHHLRLFLQTSDKI